MNILFCAEDGNNYVARESLDGKGYYIRHLDLFLPDELITAARGISTLYIMIKSGDREKQAQSSQIKEA